MDPNILEYKLDRSNLENHLVSQSNLTKIVGKILDQANYCQEKEMTNDNEFFMCSLGFLRALILTDSNWS